MYIWMVNKRYKTKITYEWTFWFVLFEVVVVVVNTELPSLFFLSWLSFNLIPYDSDDDGDKSIDEKLPLLPLLLVVVGLDNFKCTFKTYCKLIATNNVAKLNKISNKQANCVSVKRNQWEWDLFELWCDDNCCFDWFLGDDVEFVVDCVDNDVVEDIVWSRILRRLSDTLLLCNGELGEVPVAITWFEWIWSCFDSVVQLDESCIG